MKIKNVFQNLYVLQSPAPIAPQAKTGLLSRRNRSGDGVANTRFPGPTSLVTRGWAEAGIETPSTNIPVP